MTVTTTAPPAASYTTARVTAALNIACDRIITATGAPETGLRDGLNLLVNATLACLRAPDTTLGDVAADCYSEPLETVLGWIDD